MTTGSTNCLVSDERWGGRSMKKVSLENGSGSMPVQLVPYRCRERHGIEGTSHRVATLAAYRVVTHSVKMWLVRHAWID